MHDELRIRSGKLPGVIKRAINQILAPSRSHIDPTSPNLAPKLSPNWPQLAPTCLNISPTWLQKISSPVALSDHLA
eukprot:10688952-Karenia_brevis.AAC.1